jgi:hypothetical protein
MSSVTRGKSINVFLLDGDPNGRMKCTLANWTGVAYRIPRNDLEKCRDRDDLVQSGVYFLFGSEDDMGNDKVVYVGQAGTRKNGEGILYRLFEHRRNQANKGFWSEAVVFTTSNNSFGPTEISYLENRFTNMAREAKRYVVKNANDPSPGNITEEKKSELDEFIEYAQIVMGIIGHNALEPYLSTKKSSADVVNENTVDVVIAHDEQVWFLKRAGRNNDHAIDANCVQTNEGFVVRSGSRIAVRVTESLSSTIKERRNQVKIDEHGVLQEEVLFKSPSAAAAFVIGSSANGLIEWKNAAGVSYKDIENARVQVLESQINND